VEYAEITTALKENGGSVVDKMVVCKRRCHVALKESYDETENVPLDNAAAEEGKGNL
jgi:hypothetical protein